MSQNRPLAHVDWARWARVLVVRRNSQNVLRLFRGRRSIRIIHGGVSKKRHGSCSGVTCRLQLGFVRHNTREAVRQLVGVKKRVDEKCVGVRNDVLARTLIMQFLNNLQILLKAGQVLKLGFNRVEGNAVANLQAEHSAVAAFRPLHASVFHDCTR